MAKTIDTRLVWIAAQVAAQWQEYREDFAKFAQPHWHEWGGEGLVNYMINKYVNNNELSVVEYLHNLDYRNKELVVKYLISKVNSYPEDVWTVFTK